MQTSLREGLPLRSRRSPRRQGLHDTLRSRSDPASAGNATSARPLVTHRYKLDQIEEAYDLFAHQRDGVLKVAITP